MIKRLLVLSTLGVLLSGCFMVPMALIGPAASGFSTASILQSGITTTASYMVKKSTGKTIAEHALSAISDDTLKSAISDDVLKQSYFPKNNITIPTLPKSKSIK